MKVHLAAIALIPLTTIVLLNATLRAQAPAPTKSVRDGIYTEEQAKRGNPLYAQECASCHGPDMQGGEMAPGLCTGDFYSGWDGLTVGDLYERIRISMPQNSPGSLSRQQNADILAFMFSCAKYPAGAAELPTQTEVLKQIKFEAPKQ